MSGPKGRRSSLVRRVRGVREGRIGSSGAAGLVSTRSCRLVRVAMAVRSATRVLCVISMRQWSFLKWLGESSWRMQGPNGCWMLWTRLLRCRVLEGPADVAAAVRASSTSAAGSSLETLVSLLKVYEPNSRAYELNHLAMRLRLGQYSSPQERSNWPMQYTLAAACQVLQTHTILQRVVALFLPSPKLACCRIRGRAPSRAEGSLTCMQSNRD